MGHSIRGLGFALVAALVASPAVAQTRWDLGVIGGFTFPTQDASELYKPGYNIGGTVRLKKENWPVGVQFDGLFHTMATEDYRFDGGLDVLSGVVSVVWPVELENTSLTPVIHAGVGVFNLEAKYPRTSEPYGSQTKFGFSFGGGMEWRSRKSRLIPLIDLQVYGIVGSDPREAGYILLNGGLKYVFGGKKPR